MDKVVLERTEAGVVGARAGCLTGSPLAVHRPAPRSPPVHEEAGGATVAAPLPDEAGRAATSLGDVRLNLRVRDRVAVRIGHAALAARHGTHVRYRVRPQARSRRLVWMQRPFVDQLALEPPGYGVVLVGGAEDLGCVRERLRVAKDPVQRPDLCTVRLTRPSRQRPALPETRLRKPRTFLHKILAERPWTTQPTLYGGQPHVTLSTAAHARQRRSFCAAGASAVKGGRGPSSARLRRKWLGPLATTGEMSARAAGGRVVLSVPDRRHACPAAGGLLPTSAAHPLRLRRELVNLGVQDP